MFSINCSRQISCPRSLEALLDKLHVLGVWDVIWLVELDQFLREIDQQPYKEVVGGHLFFRHWGGQGNLAYGLLINSRLKSKIQTFKFGSRSAGFRMSEKGSSDFICVGVHGHADGDYVETITDFSDIVMHVGYKCGVQVAIIGDFNVDQSAIFNDNAKSLESAHKRNGRQALNVWARTHGCDMSICDDWLSLPFHLNQQFERQPIPYTWIPQGQQANMCSPSVIDYAICSSGSQVSNQIRWDVSLGDHAVFVLKVKWKFHVQESRKTRWICCDEKKATEWLCTHDKLCENPGTRAGANICTDEQSCDFHDFRDLCFELQDTFSDRSTCDQRRKNRMPLMLRNAYALVRSACTKLEYEERRKHAWQLRKKWVKDRHNKICCEKVKKNKTLGKACKLFPIDSDCVAFTETSVVEPQWPRQRAP